MSVKKNKKTSGVILITKNNLPLSCPRDNYLKLSHPKIILPIDKEDTKTIQCPYCSTMYELSSDDDF